MQKVSDEPLTICEVCSGKLEKQWSLSGFQFKGAGWYVTDYSSKLKDKSAETTDKKEKSEGAENSKKTEKSESMEKSSPTESTAKTETASNKANDNAPASSKTDSVSKKD